MSIFEECLYIDYENIQDVKVDIIWKMQENPQVDIGIYMEWQSQKKNSRCFDIPSTADMNEKG